jgi:hypothetical protein
MSQTTTISSIPVADAKTEHEQAELAKLDGLLRQAKQEHDTYLALMRKGAVHVFRCGGRLREARDLAKSLKVGWFSLLAKHNIAESTARQAIVLFEHVIHAGYTEEDIEGKSITNAKVEFGVVKSPAQQKEDRSRKVNERKHKEEAGRKEDKSRHEEVKFKVEKTGLPSPPLDENQPEGDSGESDGTDWGEIEISDLLVSRQQQLNEESLGLWNMERKRPFDEDYLLVLFDLGVLTLKDGKVRYLADQQTDREELVIVLGDKLAPILESWSTADDVVSALKGLVFAESAGVEEAKTTEAGEQKKRSVRVRRAGQQPRA